jgi:hypothetical protein
MVLWGTFWMHELCTFLKSAQNHPLRTIQVKSGRKHPKMFFNKLVLFNGSEAK